MVFHLLEFLRGCQAVLHAKYLGVVIDEHLSFKFNEHIKMITNKANPVKAFLQRNIGSCIKVVKEACYKSMVRPILSSYSACGPHLQRKISL